MASEGLHAGGSGKVAAVLHNPEARTPVLLVCEHASCFIPDGYSNLGLKTKDLRSHVVWDPGAMKIALGLSKRLNAKLIAGTVSRLLYDCNRPPTSVDAVPEQSENIFIPGNVGLSPRDRAQRATDVYGPFLDLMNQTLAEDRQLCVLVTIHSFTPVYQDRKRSVELGILHDADSRLADELLRIAPSLTDLNVQRNAPYGPDDGVTHTLKVHGIANGILNVMLEIRNDLIAAETQHSAVVSTLEALLRPALATFGVLNSEEIIL